MSKNIMQMCADEIAGYLKRIADLEKELEDWRDGTIIAQWQDCEQKVKELEKQLAESEEENETFRKALRGEIFINYEIPMENERLKQQLAEKEQEIEELRFKERNIFPLVKNLEQKVDQAKTDFAIEQIQKAWDMFSKEYFANEKMETLGTRFLARLDQQIKELRGQ